MRIFKKLLTITLLSIAFSFFASPALAAAPDGVGPWADSVLSSSQGLMKNGNPVPAIRSNPSSAIGVAENNTTDGNFFSLGFGGNIALGFDNGISSGVIIVEATNPGYPGETAKVEVSENGITWVNAGSVTADGQVNKPAEITCAKYVRITDTSDVNIFPDAIADGYDVDGVKASGEPCQPPTPPCTSAGCCNTITQNNTTTIVNGVTVIQNTGGNKANKNTGGSTSVTSGNAKSNVSITNTTGSNIAVANGCCSSGGPTNVTISGNGAGSKNVVKINSKKK